MKISFFFVSIILLLLFSFLNQRQKEKRNTLYCVEFIDVDNSEKSKKIIQQVQSKLFNKTYVSVINSHQWWLKIYEMENSLTISDSIYSIHRFKNILECNLTSNINLNKIVINYNKEMNDTMSFNFRMYKREEQQWKSIMNAGKFTYKKGKNLNEEINWMTETIVGLTFK